MRIPSLLMVAMAALAGCSSSESSSTPDLTVPGDMTVPQNGADLTASVPDLSVASDDLSTGTDDGDVTSADLTVGTPMLVIDHQPQYDFGTLVTGQASGAVTFTISNTGTAASSVVTVALSGTNAGDFAITRNDCNVTLAPNVSCSVDVVLSSPNAGSKTATLTGTATQGGSAPVTLVGNVVTPGAITVSPSPVPFGGVVVNTTADQLITLKNVGGSDTGTLSFATQGSDGAEFSVVAGGTCVAGMKLASAATCTLKVRWAPLVPGAKSASLVVSASPGGPGVASLQGTALTPAALTFSQATYTPLPNNPVAKGSTATITLTLNNTGTQASGPLPTLHTTTSTVFTVVGGTCAAGTPVAGGDSCTIVVQFAPTAFGAATDTVALTASPGGAASANLSATGQETFTLTVTRGGNGTGGVMVDGNACGSFPCVTNYVVSAGPAPDVTLTPSLDVSSNFTAWASTPSVGSCTGATCQLTMNQSRSAVATFTLKKLTVTVDLAGVRGATGSVSADVAPAMVCSSVSCTGTYDYGTSVSLTASGSGGNLFQSWAATPCASRFSSSCSTGVLTANFTTSVTFRPPINYAFVTSAPIISATLGADLLVADRFCDTLARDAGLVNTPTAPTAPYFKALLATSTASAHSRVDTAQGWIRPDGKELANDPKDLFNESGATKPYQLFYAIDVDEKGNRQIDYVATGADRNGNLEPNGNCLDWTASNGCDNPVMLGNPDAGNGFWLEQQSNCGCGGEWRLYCFETAQPAAVVAPAAPAQKRVAFVSNGTLNGGVGRDAFDTMCANEASSVGVPGTFLALLPLTGVAASARFGAGANWVRPDNVPIALDTTSFMNASWRQGFTQLANGSYAMTPNLPTWVGAGTPNDSSSADTANCAGWSDTSLFGLYNNEHGALGFGYSWFINQSCSTASRVFCLQQ